MKKETICCFIVFFIAAFAHANPRGSTVAAGKAQIKQNGEKLEITVSDRSIIDWDSFSIAPNEATQFIQPSKHCAILNRVTGGQMSELQGLLQANGRVYLINPQGIVIGKEGRVDTAGFFASALEMKNQDFLTGSIAPLVGESLGEIANWGTIQTDGGPVTLVGHKVDNRGCIDSMGGSVSLASSHSVFVDLTGDALLFAAPELGGGGVEQGGSILALREKGEADAIKIEYCGGKILLCAPDSCCAVSGEIRSAGGEVDLFAKEIQLAQQARIDVSADSGGGSVHIGGVRKGEAEPPLRADAVWMDEGASICADALASGNGGEVILWGSENVLFLGEVSARGGKEGGDGGFVEVSGKGQMALMGRVSTEAPKGKSGVYLIDPTNVCISSTGDANWTFSSPSYNYTGSSSPNFCGEDGVTIPSSNLISNLQAGNVIIDTSATVDQGTNPGDIIINDDVIWSSDFSLVLSAQNDITINGATLSCSGAGTVAFSPTGNLNLNTGTSLDFTTFPTLPPGQTQLSGDLSFTSPTAITISQATVAAPTTITSTSANSQFFLLSGSDLTIQASESLLLGLISTSSLSLTSQGSTFFFGTIDTSGGPIDVTGNSGIFFEDGTVMTVSPSSMSPITFSAPNGDIWLASDPVIQTDGNITMTTAGVLYVASGGSIQTTSPGTSITLVVDQFIGAGHNFTIPPQYGFFTFLLPPDLTICTNSCTPGGGQVQLYTSVAGINSFPTTINGAVYDPGTFSSSGIYSFGTNEFVGYWYQTLPQPANGAPFNVIFNSLSLPLFASTAYLISIGLIEPSATQGSARQNAQYSSPSPDPKSRCVVPSVSIKAQ